MLRMGLHILSISAYFHPLVQLNRRSNEMAKEDSDWKERMRKKEKICKMKLSISAQALAPLQN